MMSCMKNVLQKTRDETQKDLLRTVIAKKRKVLMDITEKLELLKMKLEKIEEEYNDRIGRLYIKDNLLDLEIIRFKKINELIECGLSFEDAVLELEENIEREKEELRDEKERMDEYFQALQDTDEKIGEKYLDIRRIWKKLVHKFHPDLTSDENEKKERGELMKKINTAYSQHDYDTLKTLEEKELVEEVVESTAEHMEKMIIDIENAITRVREQYSVLRKSQWHTWIGKTKQRKEKLLKEMEQNIICDIVKKQFILDTLKRKHNNG